MKILLDPAPTAAAGAPPVSPTPPPAPPTPPKAAEAPKAPEPPSPPPAPPADGGGDEFDDMDARIKAIRKRPEKAPEKPKEEPKAKEEPVPKEEPAPGKDLKSDSPKAMREQLAKATADIKAREESIAALEKRIAEAEAKGKDVTVLSERLAEREKALEAAHAELRAAKQEVSPEFVEKYDKPFNSMAEYAKRVVEGLPITDENGNTREAKWDDFAALYNMPYSKAIASAKETFGDAAPIVLQHIAELQKMAYQRSVALEDEKRGFAERVKAEEANRAKERESIAKQWQNANKELADKHPEWFQPDPQDADGNDLLKKGYELVDSNPATTEKKIARDARIRNQAAAFPRLAAKYEKAMARIEELEGTIAEMKLSKPGGTSKPGESDRPAPKTWREELAEELK